MPTANTLGSKFKPPFFAAVTPSQRQIFQKAWEHFRGALLHSPVQFVRNTERRLLSAGMTPDAARNQSRLLNSDIEFPKVARPSDWE